MIELKIGVVYASMSGNTEAIAERIVEELKKDHQEVFLQEVYDLTGASDLLEYDFTYIGMYTWGEGDYPDECLELIDELEQLDLQNHPFAIFGSGDTNYEEYCVALDNLKQLIEGQGGAVVVEPLKIELSPDAEDEVAIETFVRKTLSSVERV